MKNDVVIYQLLKKNPAKSSHAEKVYPAVRFIKTEDIIRHPNSGKDVRIRYAIGEDSIYVKEQSEFAEPAPSLAILDGMFRANKHEKTLIAYLDATNQNADNKNIKAGRIPFFKKIDIVSDAKKSFDLKMKKAEASQAFFELNKGDDTRFRGVARLMSVDVSNPFFNNTFLDTVNNNPEKFLNLLIDDQQLELADRLQMIYDADDRNIIKYEFGKWFWVGGHGDNEIINVSKGLDPHRALVDWTFVNDSGKGWFGTLRGLITDDPSEKLATKNEELTRKEVKVANELGLDEVSELARYYKIISWSAPNFFFNEEGKEPKNLGKTKAGIITFLKENDQALRDIKARIAIFKRQE